MPTVAVDPTHPHPQVIARAAAVIRAGELVAFPTETVYGLGAAALDPRAVAKIYAAKGRPGYNPLIDLKRSYTGVEKVRFQLGRTVQGHVHTPTWLKASGA